MQTANVRKRHWLPEKVTGLWWWSSNKTTARWFHCSKLWLLFIALVVSMQMILGSLWTTRESKSIEPSISKFPLRLGQPLRSKLVARPDPPLKKREPVNSDTNVLHSEEYDLMIKDKPTMNQTNVLINVSPKKMKRDSPPFKVSMRMMEQLDQISSFMDHHYHQSNNHDDGNVRLNECKSHDYDFLKSYKHLTHSGYATLKLHDSLMLSPTMLRLFVTTAEYYSNRVPLDWFESEYSKRHFDNCGLRMLAMLQRYNPDSPETEEDRLFILSKPISHGCLGLDDLFDGSHSAMLPPLPLQQLDERTRRSRKKKYTEGGSKLNPEFRRTNHHWLFVLEWDLDSPLHYELNRNNIKNRNQFEESMMRMKKAINESEWTTDISVTLFDIRAEVEPPSSSVIKARQFESLAMKLQDASNSSSKQRPPFPMATAPVCSGMIINEDSEQHKRVIKDPLFTISNKLKKEASQRYSLGVCTMIHLSERDKSKRDATLNLLFQFIEYHLSQGVDHFFVYRHLFDEEFHEWMSANSDDGNQSIHDLTEYHIRWINRHWTIPTMQQRRKNTQKLYRLLNGYIRNDIVTLINWRALATVRSYPSFYNTYQDSQINSCLKKFGHRSQWLAVMDIDEWMLPISHSKTVKQIMIENHLILMSSKMMMNNDDDNNHKQRRQRPCYFEMYRHLVNTCPDNVGECGNEKFENYLDRSQCIMSRQFMLKFMIDTQRCHFHTAWNHYVEYFEWPLMNDDLFWNARLWYSNRDPIPQYRKFAHSKINRFKSILRKYEKKKQRMMIMSMPVSKGVISDGQNSTDGSFQMNEKKDVIESQIDGQNGNDNNNKSDDDENADDDSIVTKQKKKSVLIGKEQKKKREKQKRNRMKQMRFYLDDKMHRIMIEPGLLLNNTNDNNNNNNNNHTRDDESSNDDDDNGGLHNSMKNIRKDENHPLFDHKEFERWLADSHGVISNIDDFNENGNELIVLMHLSHHFDREGFWQKLIDHHKFLSIHTNNSDLDNNDNNNNDNYNNEDPIDDEPIVNRTLIWMEHSKKNVIFSHWIQQFTSLIKPKCDILISNQVLDTCRVRALLNSSAHLC